MSDSLKNKFHSFLKTSLLLLLLLITELAVGQIYYNNLITLINKCNYNFVAFKSFFLSCLSPGESVQFLWQSALRMREEKSLGKAVAIVFGLSLYFPALMPV